MGSLTRSIGIAPLSVGSLCYTVAMSTAFFLACSRDSKADFDHAAAEAYGTDFVRDKDGRPVDGALRVTGHNNAAINGAGGSDRTQNGFGSIRGSAAAAVNPFGDSMFRLSSTGFRDTVAGGYVSGQGLASGGWRDVIYDSRETLGALRLNFEIEGGLTATSKSTTTGQAEATVGVREFLDAPAKNDLYTAYQLGFSGTSHTLTTIYNCYADLKSAYTDNTGIYHPEAFETYGLTNFLGTTDQFRAQFFFDVPYDRSQGGYVYSMVTAAQAIGAGGSASAQFGNTIKLTSVTRTDGTAVSESDLQFASGFRLRSVPEPSGFAMMSLGCLALLGCKWAYRTRMMRPVSSSTAA